MSSVTLASARALVGYCEHRGIDTAAMLRTAALTEDRLADPDGDLTADAASLLWEQAMDSLGDRALALQVAQFAPRGGYQLVHFLCAHSCTPGAAFELLCEHARCADGQARLSLLHATEGHAVCFARHDDADAWLHSEFALAMTYLGVARSTRLDFTPFRVQLAGPAPHDASPWRRTFRCPVEFDADVSRMWFDRAAWNLRVAQANPDLLRILRTHGRALLERTASPAASLEVRVRRVIVERLRGGPPGVSEVARTLGTSRRSLQRALREAGSSFSLEVERVRRSQASALLADGERSLTEIAHELGFSEHSAFTRAYRRWTGSAPGSDRRPRATA